MESIVSNQPPVSFEADHEHDQSQNGWIEPRTRISRTKWLFKINLDIFAQVLLQVYPSQWMMYFTLCIQVEHEVVEGGELEIAGVTTDLDNVPSAVSGSPDGAGSLSPPASRAKFSFVLFFTKERNEKGLSSFSPPSAINNIDDNSFIKLQLPPSFLRHRLATVSDVHFLKTVLLFHLKLCNNLKLEQKLICLIKIWLFNKDST